MVPGLWSRVSRSVPDAPGSGDEEPGTAPGFGSVLARALGLHRSAGIVPLLVGALLGLGLVMVYSASAITAERDPRIGDATFFLRRQAVAAGLGLSLLLVLSRLPLRAWQALAPVAFLGSLGLLVAVLVPGIGSEANGARRWLRFGSLGFQPSDLARVALVLLLARLAATRTGLVGLLPIWFAAGLIAVEPDVGTASATAAVGLVCLYIGGVRLRDLAIAAAVAGPIAAAAAYSGFGHVRARIASFTGAGDSHQLRQSLLALGAGGWAGVGLGAGRQKLLFLPEESSDFILAEVGEELGFLGTAGVIGLFGLLLLHGASVALRARDPFGAVVAAGTTLSLTLQAAVNAAVVTGCVPTKGIALPFVSAGGSCVVASCIAAAALVAVARETEREGTPEGENAGAPEHESAPRQAQGEAGGRERETALAPIEEVLA